jgi:hypothetical protein
VPLRKPDQSVAHVRNILGHPSESRARAASRENPGDLETGRQHDGKRVMESGIKDSFPIFLSHV